MKILLNTELPAHGLGMLLQRFHSIRFWGLRMGVDHDLQNMTEQALKEFRNAGFHANFLIAGGMMTRSRQHGMGPPWAPDDLVSHCREVGAILNRYDLEHTAEIGNEPDIAHSRWADNPEELADTFNRCFHAMREKAPNVRVLCPSISNLDCDSLEYLEKMFGQGIVSDADVAFHRYPHGTPPDVNKAQRGLASRAEELTRLRSIVGTDRQLWLTETGVSEGPHIKKSWGGLRKKKLWISERDVADYVRRDLDWWQTRGLEYYTLYQLNSGPDRENVLHGYGIRRYDEAWDAPWKPVVGAVEDFA